MAKKAATPEKEKTLVEKFVDVVDHALHPEKDIKPESVDAPEAPKAPEGFSMDEEIGKGLARSSSSESDYQSHPKFAKFKKEEGQ